jgi:ketosteroid isomerase-like protein
MFTYLHHMPQRWVLIVILLATSLPICGAKEDFANIAKQTLSEIHAKDFSEGNFKACVSLYAGNARFFVDNQLVATGEAELLTLYKGLREVDGVRKIVVDGFVDTGSNETLGWAIFNYTKEYDLKNRDPKFIKTHKLEGFSALNIKQYGTAIFAKIDGRWKIQTMSVFDPEIWEPKK